MENKFSCWQTNYLKFMHVCYLAMRIIPSWGHGYLGKSSISLSLTNHPTRDLHAELSFFFLRRYVKDPWSMNIKWKFSLERPKGTISMKWIWWSQKSPNPEVQWRQGTSLPFKPSIGGCQGRGDLHTPLTGLKVLHEEVKLLLRKEFKPWKLSTFWK